MFTMTIMNNNGLNTELYGTPCSSKSAMTLNQHTSLTDIFPPGYFRTILVQFQLFGDGHRWWCRIVWSTKSNAALKYNSAGTNLSPVSTAIMMSDIPCDQFQLSNSDSMLIAHANGNDHIQMIVSTLLCQALELLYNEWCLILDESCSYCRRQYHPSLEVV